MKNILSIIVSFNLFFLPLGGIVFAEESSTTPVTVAPSVVNNPGSVAPESLPSSQTSEGVVPPSSIDASTGSTPVAGSADTSAVDNSGTNPSITGSDISLQTPSDIPPIQDAVNVQEGSTSDVLVVDDPDKVVITIPKEEEDTTKENPDLVDKADDPSLTEEPEVIEENLDAQPEDLSIVEEEALIDESLNAISFEELRPKSIYKFHKTKNVIKTKRLEKNTDKNNFKKSKNIDNIISPIIDNDLGTMSFSGSCNSKYFVILLYKNAEDYLENPNKYILNKAYDCVDNAFSYTVDDLPTNLEDGDYYLLIGQQGDVGSWVPVSDLTEININKSL